MLQCDIKCSSLSAAAAVEFVGLSSERRKLKAAVLNADEVSSYIGDGLDAAKRHLLITALT